MAEKDKVDTKTLPGLGHPLEATVGTLGAVSGAGFGAIAAGPAGAIIGGLIGAAVGATTGWAADENTVEKIEADKALDDEIGVTSGSLGAPNLEHPEPRIAAPSAASAGASVGAPQTAQDADGPLGNAVNDEV
ncbi:MAG TPA: hypothetical protein VFQ35_06010 [Polyangiaceae bacterium]|nr:hypothetical protein [Polyangiaceae bacterium]